MGDATARLVTFGATVYLARVLGADGYGVVALALGVILYAQTVVDFGVETLGIRRVAADPGAVVALGSAYLGARLLLAILLAGAIAVVSLFALPAPDGPIIALYTLTLVPVALSTRWIHIGLESTLPVGLARVLGDVTVALVIVLTVRGQEHLSRVPLAQFAGDALAMAWLWYRLRSSGRAPRLVWDGPRARELAASAWPLAGHSLLGLVIYNSDLLFLRLFGDLVAVGLYAAAYTLVSFLLNVGWAYSQSLLPTLTRLKAEGADAAGLFSTAQAQVFAVTIPIAVGGWLVAEPMLTRIFGSEYQGAGVALAVLIWSIPLSVVRSVGVVGLIAHERQDLALRTTTSSVVVNLVLNVLLIPRFGILGAASATLVTEAMRAVLALRFVRQEGYPPLALARFTKSAGAALTMGLAVWATLPLGVWIAVATGVAVYVVAMVLVGGVRIRGGLRLAV